MKKYFIVLLLITLTVSHLSSQPKDWISKEIGNGISVSFPDNPIYQTTQSNSLYTATNSNCLFMALINRNVIPQNYEKFVQAESKWTEEERKKVAYSFLDNYVKGKTSGSGSNAITSNVKMGQLYGKKVEYSAVNPATGEVGKRFSIILALLKYNKIISFECWYLNNSTTANNEKMKFFNSINVK